jgi:hypothetical protein
VLRLLLTRDRQASQTYGGSSQCCPVRNFDAAFYSCDLIVQTLGLLLRRSTNPLDAALLVAMALRLFTTEPRTANHTQYICPS